VKTWDNLWKEDLSGLKKARSYAKLTKGLWSNTAPDAAMAYYLPNTYKGSLAEYYQEPRGERTATENNAHDNSIVPVPGHKGPYYSSDFTRGEAKPAPPPVARVYGNRPNTNEASGMAPMTQGLYSGKGLQHPARAQQSAARDHGRRESRGRGSGVVAKEHKVADALRSLNEEERRRIAATRGILLKSPATHTTALAAGAAGADGPARKAPSSSARLQTCSFSLACVRARARVRALSLSHPLSPPLPSYLLPPLRDQARARARLCSSLSCMCL